LRPEDLKRLQTELLEGLDSGESEDGGEVSAAEARAASEAKGAEALRERAVLAAAGEECVEDVTQLVLRERQLESLVAPGALDFARLVGLEVLSLSNNRLTDITPLASLVSLVEVNVNFNQISDLTPLYECEQLEKLFASHNQVASVDGLEDGCPQIRELSLFANQLGDSKAVLRTLRGLPELRVLDLGENECSSGPSQRYTLLQRLPKLEQLDGHNLGALDRQLARDFFAGAGREMSQGSRREPSPEAEASPLAARPCTAPPASSSSRPPLLPGAGGRSVPLLLPGAKLRSSQSNLMDEVLTQSRDPSPDASPTGGLPVLEVQLDMSNPSRTLRKLDVYVDALSRHLEVLQMERDNLKFQLRLLERDGRESCSEGLREQLRAMEEENRNLPAVESEHELLLSRLEKAERELADLQAAEASRAQTPASSSAAGLPDDPDLAEDDEVSELRWENQLLRKRLRRMQQYSESLQEDEFRTRLKTGCRPRTGAWLPEHEQEDAAGADEDPEIASLVAANEAKLRDLRGEVRDTATALARKKQAFSGPADPRGVAGVDVLTIGEGLGVEDVEWHGTR